MAKREVFHSSFTKKDGWVVTSEGKTLSKNATQSENEAEAMRLGKAAHTSGGLGQAVLHREDGVIKEERTYGKDPRDVPG